MNRSTNIADPTKACEFLQLAKSVLAAGGSNNDAVLYAEETKASPRVIAFLKATPGNSTSGWGADLTDMAASGVAPTLWPASWRRCPVCIIKPVGGGSIFKGRPPNDRRPLSHVFFIRGDDFQTKPGLTDEKQR
jgi:hypothetical protein